MLPVKKMLIKDGDVWICEIIRFSKSCYVCIHSYVGWHFLFFLTIFQFLLIYLVESFKKIVGKKKGLTGFSLVSHVWLSMGVFSL